MDLSEPLSSMLAFIRRHKLGVLATVAESGAAQSAVIGIAACDDLSLLFDTIETSRKARNLLRDPRASLVIGWDEAQTIQLEGVVDRPAGEELLRLKPIYFASFPDGPDRQAWPGITYFRVRPTWIRYSDFRGAEPVLVEVEVELDAGAGPRTRAGAHVHPR